MKTNPNYTTIETERKKVIVSDQVQADGSLFIDMSVIIKSEDSGWNAVQAKGMERYIPVPEEEILPALEKRCLQRTGTTLWGQEDNIQGVIDAIGAGEDTIDGYIDRVIERYGLQDLQWNEWWQKLF